MDEELRASVTDLETAILRVKDAIEDQFSPDLLQVSDKRIIDRKGRIDWQWLEDDRLQGFPLGYISGETVGSHYIQLEGDDAKNTWGYLSTNAVSVS